MNHIGNSFQALQPLFLRTTFGSAVSRVETVWFYKLVFKKLLTFLLICGDDIFHIWPQTTVLPFHALR